MNKRESCKLDNYKIVWKKGNTLKKKSKGYSCRRLEFIEKIVKL